MALPWQGDFHACHTYWWPASHPAEVLPEPEHDALIQVAAEAFREWDRDVGDADEMVAK
ncbi:MULTISPECIES: hypothetical protein [unclassified Streptomyces]|uniref:hypothetical protein n=1 Tax=unclassified Streptomyces TaxID=2593676 RepID=UPI002E137FF9|nr:hypothetical protein OG324_46260 [Streptomyces sp. NBC_01236]